MGTRYVTILIGVIVGYGVVSLITGEFQWGILIGLLVGMIIAEILRGRREKTGEVQTDERVENNTRKFMLLTMGASLFLLLIYLMVADFILGQEFIKVKYVMYYVLATFVVCLFIGPAVVRRR